MKNIIIILLSILPLLTAAQYEVINPEQYTRYKDFMAIPVSAYGVTTAGSGSSNATKFATALASGKNVYIDISFTCDPVNITQNNITIFGKGDSTIMVKKSAGSAGVSKLFNITGSNVKVMGFTIDGNATNLAGTDTATGIYSTGYATDIGFMWFKNTWTAIETHEIDYLNIHDNKFDSLGFSATRIFNGHSPKITNNIVYGWGKKSAAYTCFYWGSFVAQGGLHNPVAMNNTAYNKFSNTNFMHETGGASGNVNAQNGRFINETLINGGTAGGISMYTDSTEIAGWKFINCGLGIGTEISGSNNYVHDFDYGNTTAAFNSRLENIINGLRLHNLKFTNKIATSFSTVLRIGGTSSIGGVGGQGVANKVDIRDIFIDVSASNCQYPIILGNYAGDRAILNDMGLDGIRIYQNPSNSYGGGYGINFDGTSGNRISLKNIYISGNYSNSGIIFTGSSIYRNVTFENIKSPNGVFDASLTTTVAPNYITTNIVNDTTSGPGTSINGVTKIVGTGSPEGVITAAVGSTFSRTNGGAGTTYYIKESGSGNTGWVPAASLVSPPFTGIPTAPTASVGTNTTQLATTAYTDRAAGYLQTVIATAGSSTLAQIKQNLVTIDPASTMASYTLTTPASPNGGDIITIVAGGTIALSATVVTAFTFTANSGQTVYGTIISPLVGGDKMEFIYDSGHARWFRTK